MSHACLVLLPALQVHRHDCICATCCNVWEVHNSIFQLNINFQFSNNCINKQFFNKTIKFFQRRANARAGRADMALERMESNIMAVLRHDMECIAAIHCLKVYCQRLGCDLSNGVAVRRAAGCAFALATEALSDMAILQVPPSLTAAAILVAARRAQVNNPSCGPHNTIACPPPYTQ